MVHSSSRQSKGSTYCSESWFWKREMGCQGERNENIQTVKFVILIFDPRCQLSFKNDWKLKNYFQYFKG